MRVHLVNPSALAFGVGVITPRWLYVLAAATPEEYGDPIVTDETLERWDLICGVGRRRGRHRHPHRQRGSGVRNRQEGTRVRRLRRVRGHPRHAVSGGSRRARRGACGRQR